MAQDVIEIIAGVHYLVYVEDGFGKLFFVRTKPDPEIWLRPGATATDVAKAVEKGPDVLTCLKPPG
jgi:hypothetical protein